MPTKTARKIGPYSRPARLAKLDGRTREARMMQQTRADLIRHVGGAPSATQMALIEEVARLQLRLALMDRATFASGGWPEGKDGRQYIGWTNTLIRTLARLGLRPPQPARKTIAQILAEAPQDPHDDPPAPQRRSNPVLDIQRGERPE